MDNVISIKNLKIELLSAKGIIHAVRGINLDIKKGEIHGLVGESGCGKTMTAKALLRLHDDSRTEYSGEILFNDEVDILKLKKKDIQKLRGNDISMVFQDPTTSLNPLITVGEQICEMMKVHENMDVKRAYVKTLWLLEKVGIHPAEKRFKQYPFELSGGIIQRIMIAIAISCNPKFLIADEATTALDVTIQAQILQLFKNLQRNLGMTIMLITHNFGVVAEVCDRVSVMYAGKIVETGDVKDIFTSPVHPYTMALINSTPKPGCHSKPLETIQGSPPELLKKINGCAYAPRCKFAAKKCTEVIPEIIYSKNGHTAACHLEL